MTEPVQHRVVAGHAFPKALDFRYGHGGPRSASARRHLASAVVFVLVLAFLVVRAWQAARQAAQEVGLLFTTAPHHCVVGRKLGA